MQDIPPALPHGDITEVFDDIFFVTGQIKVSTLSFSRNMVVIRAKDELTLINTLRLDDAGLARLDELGTVRNVIRLGGFHGRDDAFYLNRYDAALWALEGTGFNRGEVITHALAEGAPCPINDASVFAWDTPTSPEAMLQLARHGGIVIACDALQNIVGPDEYFDDESTKAMEKMGFFHPGNVGPGWLKAKNPPMSDFERLKTLRFENLLSAHGSPFIGGADAAVSKTLNRLFGI